MQTHKFLFETSFDPEEIARRESEQRRRAASPAPVAPTFSEAQLADARKRGHSDGEQAGRAAAMASLEARLTQAVEQLPEQLATLLGERNAADSELRAQTVQVALTLTQKLVPELARRHGLAEIEAVIVAALAEMLDEPRLVIRVSDANLDPVRERIGGLTAAQGFGGAVVLLADPTLGPADCRVEWADGGTARLSSRLWQDIEDTISRALRTGDPTTPWPALQPH